MLNSNSYSKQVAKSRFFLSGKNFFTAFLIIMLGIISFRSTAQCNFFLPDKTNFNVLGSAYSDGNGCFHLTNYYSQTGAVWYRDSADLNYDFDVSFNTTQCGTADGMMFILQSCSNGLNTLGGVGGQLGYYGNSGSFTHSLGVEFDIYNNGPISSDSNNNHFVIVRDDATTILAGPVTPSSYMGDCTTRTMRFTWNATSHVFSVYMNGALQTSYTEDLIANVFAGNPYIYFGFTAGTGGEYATQTFCTNYLHYHPSHSQTFHITYNSQCPGGTLSTPAGGASYLWSNGATTNTTTATTAGTYTVTVTDSSGCSRSADYTVNPAPGDPSVFGDHVWNVYAWNAGNGTDSGGSWTNNYSGYYVETNLSFNTQNRWYLYNEPSDASGYQGCPVGSDNHSWSAKRQGFTCGTYQVNIPGHDDAAQLFVNGVKVWEHIGCCDSHANVWTGFLGETSTVEFRCSEGVGGSWASIELVPVNFITLNGPSTICPGYSLQLTAGLAASYLWSTGETTQSISVSASGNYSVDMTSSGCTISDSKTITVAAMDTPAISSNTGFNYCPATGAYLSINGDPRYSSVLWSNGETSTTNNLSNGGNYSVTVSDALGCSATSHASVISPPGNEADFGNDVWKVNAYVETYSNGYAGYYIDSSFNFDSRNKWDPNSSPSTASNYQGCTVNNDYHSFSAKREGFPCGIYQIDIVDHDDDAALYVNGVTVWYHFGGCCDSHTNVWTGVLDANSTVELGVTEFAGASIGALQITLLTDTPSFINVTGNPVVCTGQFYTLSSSITGSSYSWSNSDTTNSIQAGVSGDYSVTVTVSQGCSFTSAPVTINVLPDAAPVANITASSTIICNWSPVTLSSDSTSGNYWNNDDWSFYDETQNVSISNTGNYTLTVANSAGCFAQSTISIGKGYIPPAPVASNSGPVCENSSVDLMASGLAPGGQAIVCNSSGLGQYVNVVQDIPENDFSIELWVKTTAVSGGIFSARNNAGGTDRRLLLFNNQLRVFVAGSSTWITPFTINDGEWHHIALVVETGVGQIVYVDGFSSGIGRTWDHSTFTGQNSFRIGNAPGVSPNTFNGQIDNVRIWSEARSDSDIRSNMFLESPVDTSHLIYEGTLNGDTVATIGNNGTAPNGISYAAPDYYTYQWIGPQWVSVGTSETQTNPFVSASGTYTVTASIDEGCSPSAGASTDVTVIPLVNYYPDDDGDGYGSSTAFPLSSCTNPGAGYVINNTDCDDGNGSVWQSASLYIDADGDGYDAGTVNICYGATIPSGYSASTLGTDCNDAAASVHPGAIDICNGIDDNCNGQTDENAITGLIVTAPTPICAGGTLQLSSSSTNGNSYSWTGPNGFSSSLQNPAITNATTNASGTYIVTVSNGISGCVANGVTVATVNAATAITTQPISVTNCTGSSATFSVTAVGTNTGYQWQKKGNGNMWNNISGATNSSYTINNLQTSNAGNYRVVVSGSCGNVTSNSVTLTVNVLPTSTASSNSPVCSGKILNLSSTGGGTYSWSGPNGFSSSLQSPSISNVTTAATGTYTVSVSNGTCTSTAATSVTVNATPVVTASSNSPVCAGSTISLTSSSASSYSWTGPNGFTSTQRSPNISNATTAASGTYSVTQTNSSGCSATATTSVTVNATTAITTQPSGQTICSGIAATFSVSATGTALTYQWMKANNNISGATNATYTINSATGNDAGSYKVVVAGTCGSVTSNTVTLTVNSCNCNNASTMSTTGITSSGATLNWTATVDPQQWQVQYKKSNGGSWTNIVVPGSSRSTTITGLQKNTSYIWHIRANCSGVWTTYSGNVSFTTLSAKEDEQVVSSSEVKLNLYPNPNKGDFVIELSLNNNSSSDVEVQIINMVGQVIYTNRTAVTDGELKQGVQLDQNVPSGNYFVRVILDDNVYTGQIVLQK